MTMAKTGTDNPAGGLLGLAALSAAMAIAAAAFGAHGASSPLTAGWLRTGGEYQLTHAISVLVLARWPGMRSASLMLLVGSLIFAVTLYAMAIGAPLWLGAVTPIGGTLMILGWIWAAWRFFRGRS